MGEQAIDELPARGLRLIGYVLGPAFLVLWPWMGFGARPGLLGGLLVVLLAYAVTEVMIWARGSQDRRSIAAHGRFVVARELLVVALGIVSFVSYGSNIAHGGDVIEFPEVVNVGFWVVVLWGVARKGYVRTSLRSGCGSRGPSCTEVG
ncbi:hypothetical protein [Nocardioides nematodiphilus]|uniref:hypothetical protein n=1 Tax=Nocardioides nematodiphilus TaxID=2849669 RepID=UPI001CDA07E3|nr:hypothetical protein [Nocardioides nematodiphilus]MCA1982082.1 hypothetical protein [Nocardioides nematodiphilus]